MRVAKSVAYFAASEKRRFVCWYGYGQIRKIKLSSRREIRVEGRREKKIERVGETNKWRQEIIESKM